MIFGDSLSWSFASPPLAVEPGFLGVSRILVALVFNGLAWAGACPFVPWQAI